MLDRSIAPVAADIERPNIPITEEITLSGGIPLTILNQGDQPVVLFEMVVPVGRRQESKPDLTYYTFKMLTEGTASKSSETIASAVDFYGSHLEITPTLDSVSIRLYSLNRFFPQLLDLLMELLTESVFPQKEFDTLQQIRIQNIRQEYAKNNAFANVKFREMLFGATHPYGFMTSEEITARITREDAFNNRTILHAHPRLFLAGMASDEVVEAIRKCFANGVFGQVASEADSSVLPVPRREVITREDSTQASLRMGFLSIDRQHPDFHQLKVANELLGGFFGSRLMKNIREDKGLTYGIRSGFVHLQDASYWTISSELLRDKLDLAEAEISKEIRRMQSDPPGQREFEMVINYLKGKFLSSFDSPFSSLTMIKNLRLANLPEDYFFAYFDTLQRITPEQICQMAATYWKEEHMSSLVVI